jgi:hypothetical protein
VIDFFTSTWGIIILVHLIGWVVFQPYIVRAIDRNALPNCRQGNSPEHCQTYHGPACRFKNGIHNNVEPGAFWGGTALAFAWEPAMLFFLMLKRASAPDAVQKEYIKEKDRVSIKELKAYEQRKADLENTRALPTRAATDDDDVVEAELVDTDNQDEVEQLREIYEAVTYHRSKKANDYYHKMPKWMEDA